MARPQPSARPNIILVVIDDLGWADLGCYGSTFYETPRMDRLAGEGIRFTDAYAAAPVCSPTRASMMAGKYPARVGVTQFIGGHSVGKLCDVPYSRELPMSEYSMARALRDAGYRTWHVGKWHLGGRRTWPDRHGFDVNVGGCDWGSPQTYVSPYNCPTLSDGPDGEYLTDRLTDEAIALINQADDRPFFLNLWHYAVHIPIQAPDDLVQKYSDKARDLGIDALDPFQAGEPMPAWHQRHQRVSRRRIQSDPAYAAMVENLDTNLGRVLDAVEQAGHADNTVVIITSDNGGLATAETSPTCNAPLSEGKGWMADGGVRVPLIVRWPGVTTPGSVTDAVVTSPDFYPTLMGIAGAEPDPRQCRDGVDFCPVLGDRPFERGPVYWHYPHYSNQGGTPGAAVRDGRWKMIRYFEGDDVELYDVTADIAEQHDLSCHEPEQVRRLGRLLDQWLVDIGARIPAVNPWQAFDDLPG